MNMCGPVHAHCGTGTWGVSHDSIQYIHINVHFSTCLKPALTTVIRGQNSYITVGSNTQTHPHMYTHTYLLPVC